MFEDRLVIVLRKATTFFEEIFPLKQQINPTEMCLLNLLYLGPQCHNERLIACP